MSYPTFYWYPDSAGTLEKLSLGEGLSDIQESPRATVEDVYAGDGVPYRSHKGTTQRVRIVLDRFGSSPGVNAIERKLLALQAHLFKGLPVGFSRDDAKTWAELRTAGIARGDTSWLIDGNELAAWSASGTLELDDELVLESAFPESQTEVVLVDGFQLMPNAIEIQSPGAVFTYAGTVLSRWRDFYPVLVLPADQVGKPIVTHDHRRNWTLDVTLEYAVAMAISLWDAGSPPDLKGVVGTGSSLQALIRGGG